MKETQICTCCGAEMEKNAIGEHYTTEVCLTNLRASKKALQSEVDRLNTEVQSLEDSMMYINDALRKIHIDVLVEFIDNVLGGKQ